MVLTNHPNNKLHYILNHVDQTVDGGSWFFEKSMLALAVYDGLCDPSSVALPLIPVWV